MARTIIGVNDAKAIKKWSREFDTWRVILGTFGAIVLRNQALRKAAKNCLYWQI